VSRSGRRTVAVVVAALAVAILLAWASVAGPTRIVVEQTGDGVATKPLDRPREQQSHEDRKELERALRTKDPSWGADTLTMLGLLISLLFLGVVARGLVAAISARLPDKQLVLDVDALTDPLDLLDREALAHDVAQQHESLERGDVRDAIVACWVRLEELALEAGVVRLPSDTATELVERFLRALEVDPRPVADLARLFHEARFSSHAMGEDARVRARTDLDDLHRELAGTRA
jgi:hypothetical protein